MWPWSVTMCVVDATASVTWMYLGCAATLRACGAVFQNGNTALLAACLRGHLKVAKRLVAAGSDAMTEKDNVRGSGCSARTVTDCI